MSNTTINIITKNNIDTLNQNIGIDGKNVDQQNTRIKPFNNCGVLIDSFTDRSTVLSDLANKFNEHNIVVIHGVAGVGKTQLARKFAMDNINNYNYMFWFQAEFQEKLIKMLHELAIELNIEVKKNGMYRNQKLVRNEIYAILKTQRALLILDNIRNEGDIKEFLPTITELKDTKLHILITSQFLNWNKSTGNCLPLTPLQKIHALELLNKILDTNRVNTKDRNTLVHLLDYMPLAIQIAASYINMQMRENSAFTITRYNEKIFNGTANIHKQKHIEYGKTLGMSIKMSLDIICEDNAYAMELVYIMAFLNTDFITKEVLLKILKINTEDAKDDFHEAFFIIINYSLISSFDKRLHLHRNIQEIIRDELTQRDEGKFSKCYELMLDYILNNEDQIFIRNTFVFKHAKDYKQLILQYYKASKSAKLLQLLCKHGCLKNLEVIFAPLNEVNFLIEQHGLLHYATLSSNIETVKIICKYKIDVNMKYGTDNTTSLHIACKHGYADIADFLIGKGADINIKCENGRVALHYASSGLYYDIVQRLLHISPTTVEEKDKKNQTPLHLVLNTHKFNENNDKTLQIARLLVEKGANPDTTNDDSYKLIHIAAHNGNYDFLAYLLNNYKLDVNAKNKDGNTPLVCAVAACILISEDHIMNTIKLLIRKRANVETINNDGSNMLHIASKYCHTKVISYLIQAHKISIDTLDNYSQSPLFYALLANKSISEHDVMATVKLLIENGANAETITNDGCSLLHVAAEYCHNQIISYLIQEHKISIHKIDSYGRTPLFCAIRADKSISEDDVMATVKLLIENGASVETINNDGCILLHVASQYCHDKIISYLIQEHNISVRTTDSSGWTPLFYTLHANKSISEDDVIETIKLLVDHGATVDVTDNKGCTILHYATQFGRYKALTYLLQHYIMDINTKDQEGDTALHRALIVDGSKTQKTVKKFIKALLFIGASINLQNNKGQTALDLASPELRNFIRYTEASKRGIPVITEQKQQGQTLDDVAISPERLNTFRQRKQRSINDDIIQAMPKGAQNTYRSSLNVDVVVPPSTTTVSDNEKVKVKTRRMSPPIPTLPSPKRLRVEKKISISDDSVHRALNLVSMISTHVPLHEYITQFNTILAQFPWTMPEMRKIASRTGFTYDDTRPELTVNDQLTKRFSIAFAEEQGRVICTTGDNSCLFHAFSLLIYGHEHNDQLFRWLCCVQFLLQSTYYDDEHNKLHLDYISVPLLIHNTALAVQSPKIIGDDIQRIWGGSAHLKAMSDIARRDVYVYMADVDPEQQRWSLVDLQIVLDPNHQIRGSCHTRYQPSYDPIPDDHRQAITLLLSDAGTPAAHYSAILPLHSNIRMLRPTIVIPPPRE